MPLSGSAAPPVVIVFGLEDATCRWLTRQLRAAGVMAIAIHRDLPEADAHAIVAAADAGVHVLSATRGMDGTFLDYWQLLAESGKARIVAVHDLGPAGLDINEAAAIATRVLEEDILPTTMPLLDDDESVMGVLDAISGEQWFPDGHREPPRTDFTEAVEMETTTLYDEAAGDSPAGAIRAGMVCPAVTVDVRSRAGVDWLAAHLPPRTTPAVATVLPGDDENLVLLAAGGEPIPVGTAMVVSGSQTTDVRIISMADPLEPGLLAAAEPGRVVAARCEPTPPIGGYLLG